MKLTDQEYGAMVQQLAKPSPMAKDLTLAFCVGGGICALGQLIEEGFLAAGLALETASTATSISLIALSVLFTALGLYDDLAKRAGAGTLVPVTGFANSVAAPAIEYKTEGYVTPGGMASKMFNIAGPVLVFGIGASVLYGLVLILFRLV
ncbi:MAG: SpoVA/SpoVAEb family sporulation membrane protein [Oscillospiraceae bacterium]|nr:SpoVA/SpoVAEb family sporulation membrane protein [Oscillospiraceae bacterium]